MGDPGGKEATLGTCSSSPTMAAVPQPSVRDPSPPSAGPSNISGPFCTPKKIPMVPSSCSTFLPDCDDELKPKVGMSFDSLDAVEEFYKIYAHEAGFAVRIGAQTKVLGIIENKRFLCTRQGFSKKSAKSDVALAGNQKNSKKPKMRSETRCGCNAQIYVKLGPDKRYYIASMIEHHNHGLVSPDKIMFLRSNRTIRERVKTALFTCHKASIGTS
ncbi:hypothetical protein PAHAL_9G255200 [Panicum hallii]|uniref:FAR1 domain-containing protein n=1 Tax=Panicum hallii TaxID=206008 RepID=A0A2T8I2J6_9POAL|nr:protein FAR1-RELATED SEQUENCE 5-like [Panicum hallii]PVH31896.1 hypothetical protein PAHAL_9G255200 [Panicum hallii]